MRKQITSLLMALLMLLTLLPTSVWAEDAAADDQPGPAIIDQAEPEEPTTPATPEEPAEPAQPEEPAVPEAPDADETESGEGGIALYSSASGQCGSNLTWSLDNGTLTISGNGAMWSWDNEWYGFYEVLADQAYEVTSVEVKSGVTSISPEAFRLLENMTSVTIPKTVTSIGCNAFLVGCDALTTIKYAGTTSQWKSRFGSILSLPLATNVVCSNGTITPALSGTCGKNVKYSISDDGVLTISGTGAMNNFTYKNDDSSDCPWHGVRYALREIIVEEGVTSIGSYAFSFAIYVTDVTLPSSLKTIGNDAFWGCHGLTSVVIPEGVTTIGAYAFEQCTSIETITVPASATELGDRAFITWEYYDDSYHFALTDIYYGGSRQQWYDAGGGDAALVDVPVHFNGNTGDAIDGGQCGANASWKLDKNYTLTIYGTGDMYDYYPDDNDYLTSPWVNFDVEKIDVQEGITSIGAYALCRLDNVTKVSLPSTLTTIGQDALYAIGVSSLVIPDKVVSIGDYAFNGCGNLQTITLPAGLRKIGSCFIECGNLKTINFKGTMEQWLACGGGESTFPAQTQVVCASGTLNLDDTCGDNLTWTLDNSGKLTVSGTGAMYDYDYDYESYSFTSPWAKYRSMIRSVEIGSGVTSIGSYAFVDTNITSLTIPGSVTAIGDNGVSGNRYLATLTLNSGLETIGAFAFSDCRIGSVTIPDGVTSIGEGAFSYCVRGDHINGEWVDSGLTSITIPASVISIGKDMLKTYDEYDLLTTVNYGGTQEQWNAAGGKNAGVPSTATITYATVVGNGSCGTGVKWSLTSTGVLTITASTGKGIMKDYAEGSTKPWESKGDVKQIVICEGVTHIGDHAFANSPATRVSLPESLTSIGTRAFASADITSLTIPGSVTTIGVEVFWNCSKLTSLTIRDGVTTIESAFGACTGLTELVLPDSVTSIGTQAFYSCTGLETVTFSKNLTSIGYMAFSGCTALEEVVFPDALTEIAQEAFRNCTGLNAITLGSGITTIDRMAFRDCAPDSVDYMGTAKQWDNVSVGIYNECLDDIRCITLGVITSGGAEPDIRDVAAIYDNLVGAGESLDARQAKAADVNQDGRLDVYDLQRLYECVALGKTL